MNIQIIRDNSLNLNRGFRVDWMDNLLADALAMQLIAEGSAIVTDVQNPMRQGDYLAPKARTISLGTAYQCTDPTKSCILTVNLTSQSSVSLAGTVNNEGGIWIGPTNNVATAGAGSSQIGSYKNALGGSLVVGLNLSAAQSQPITFALPAGWYFAVRQTIGTGLLIVSAFEQIR